MYARAIVTAKLDFAGIRELEAVAIVAIESKILLRL